MLPVCPLYWGLPKSLLFYISNSPVWLWPHRIPEQHPVLLFRTYFPLKIGRDNSQPGTQPGEEPATWRVPEKAPTG